MDSISGIIILPAQLSGTVYVSVALVDASIADVASVPLSSMTFQVVDPVPDRIHFELRLPSQKLTAGNRWLFDVTVSRMAGILAVGDYVLARSIQYDKSCAWKTFLLPLELVS